MSNPVQWFQVCVASGNDVDPVANFYARAFNWSMTTATGRMAFAETGAGGIPGGICTVQDGYAPGTITIYVGVDDLDRVLDRVKDAGGQVEGPVIDLPDGRGGIAHVRDPAGNVVGLFQAAKASKGSVKSRAKPKKKAARR